MIKHREPIPIRIYNAAVGGYVHDSQNKTILISGNSYRVYNWMPITLIQL